EWLGLGIALKCESFWRNSKACMQVMNASKCMHTCKNTYTYTYTHTHTHTYTHTHTHTPTPSFFFSGQTNPIAFLKAFSYSQSLSSHPSIHPSNLFPWDMNDRLS
ncbi:hypothetical protein LOAG_12251, partial [Loa loa]